ncbi:Hypothetical protein D9617_26g078600 [Elsinoe fawcettii]|nr:Hypothetical protein D9617_26g078600 [Elsinoe fawcettii]
MSVDSIYRRRSWEAQSEEGGGDRDHRRLVHNDDSTSGQSNLPRDSSPISSTRSRSRSSQERQATPQEELLVKVGKQPEIVTRSTSIPAYDPPPYQESTGLAGSAQSRDSWPYPQDKKGPTAPGSRTSTVPELSSRDFSSEVIAAEEGDSTMKQSQDLFPNPADARDKHTEEPQKRSWEQRSPSPQGSRDVSIHSDRLTASRDTSQTRSRSLHHRINRVPSKLLRLSRDTVEDSSFWDDPILPMRFLPSPIQIEQGQASLPVSDDRKIKWIKRLERWTTTTERNFVNVPGDLDAWSWIMFNERFIKWMDDSSFSSFRIRLRKNKWHFPIFWRRN